MKHPKTSAPSQRQLRVGEDIRHLLAELFQRGAFHEPGFENINLLTVTDVRVSPDLKNGTVYVRSLTKVDLPELVKALNQAAKFIQSEVAGKMTTKNTPRLSFEVDHSLDYASHIDALLNSEKVKKDLEKEDGQA